jgi:hypothetical protein
MVSDICRSVPQGARLKSASFAIGVGLAAGSSFWHPPRPNPSVKGTSRKRAAPYLER